MQVSFLFKSLLCTFMITAWCYLNFFVEIELKNEFTDSLVRLVDKMRLVDEMRLVNEMRLIAQVLGASNRRGRLISEGV